MKEIDLYEIFPKVKGVKYPMRIPKKVVRSPPGEKKPKSLLERYQSRAAKALEDAEEIGNIINNA